MDIPNDLSNGYERIAARYIAGRGKRRPDGFTVGGAVLQRWASSLPVNSVILDLGCGPGEPSTRILREAGHIVFGVDASPSMVAAYRQNFPDAQIECNSVEASSFFSRKFDAVLAWGLLFLLDAEAQELVIRKVARALELGGQFVFTSPPQILEWRDAMTGLESRSLGAEAYRHLLHSYGMTVTHEEEDEGQNHYYFSRLDLKE